MARVAGGYLHMHRRRCFGCDAHEVVPWSHVAPDQSGSPEVVAVTAGIEIEGVTRRCTWPTTTARFAAGLLWQMIRNLNVSAGILTL